MVSRSSAKAVYRAMTEVSCELKWIKSLLLEFGISHDRTKTIQCDTKAAIHIRANLVFHERTKYIKNDCHFIRDTIINGSIKTSYISSAKQLADEKSSTFFFKIWAFATYMLQLKRGIRKYVSIFPFIY